MPIRLAILGSSPCGRCNAQCCRQTVSEYAVLLADDDERQRFAAWSIWLNVADESEVSRLERVIPYRAGRCPFLADDDRCSIYADRPAACRAFECVRHFNQHGPGGHGYFVARNAIVRSMLEAL
jgi:Fe-S-cluster containining protein